MNILKAIGAILAGFIFIIITHTGTDSVLEWLGFFPKLGERYLSDMNSAIALAYRTIFTVAGGYLTAFIAPDSKMRYVVILGIIGALLGMIGAVATIPLNLGPAWYPIALAVLALPSVWLGGKMYSQGKSFV